MHTQLMIIQRSHRLIRSSPVTVPVQLLHILQLFARQGEVHISLLLLLPDEDTAYTTTTTTAAPSSPTCRPIVLPMPRHHRLSGVTSSGSPHAPLAPHLSPSCPLYTCILFDSLPRSLPLCVIAANLPTTGGGSASVDPDLLRAMEEFHTGVTNGALRVSVTHLCGDDCTFEALVAFAQVGQCRLSPRLLYLLKEVLLSPTIRSCNGRPPESVF